MNVQSKHDTFGKLSEAEQNLQKLANRIQKPFAIIDANKVRGFRFANPGPIHYVVLNVSRSISLLNAMLLLREHGFRGEVAILARALKENTSKLDYVVGGLSLDGVDKKSESFLKDFFDDNDRDTAKRERYSPIRQKDINSRNSERVTKNIDFLKYYGFAKGLKNDGDNYANRESNLINIFSNHVHGRYPEMMDVFGEFSFRPQLRGNTESQDIDEQVELEFLDECTNGFVTGFKTAMLGLNMIQLVQLSEEERSYCIRDAFNDE